MFTTRDTLLAELHAWTADHAESESRAGPIAVRATVSVEGDGADSIIGYCGTPISYCVAPTAIYFEAGLQTIVPAPRLLLSRLDSSA